MKGYITRPARRADERGEQRSALRRPPSAFRHQSLFGFTLVELLAVITIITMLAALVVGGASYALRKAAMARCYANMETIKNALSDYSLDHGGYPLGTEDGSGQSLLYKALISDPLNNGRPTGEKNPYLHDTSFVTKSSPLQLVDPWGNYYRYKAPGGYNQNGVDLWSCGPDGNDDKGLKDDINNWSSGR